ncbi:MAG: MarR family transcriptional regulator [Proteobacteria bacterium]|nr:MarR family transcriptional regulator [Pseudomonadota bacterium]
MNIEFEGCNAALLALRKIMRAVDLHSRQLKNKFGITGPQILVLKEIARLKSVATSVLARNINLSHATVTSILDRLQSRKYIERFKDPKDKRKTLVRCTANSMNQISIHGLHLLQEEFVQQFNKLEDWEKSQITYVLQRVAHMMHATNLPASPILASGDLNNPDTD